MASKKILVVFGATGNQGGSVIRFLSDPAVAIEWTIYAITRSPTNAAAKSLVGKGVNILQVCIHVFLCLGRFLTWRGRS